MSFFSFISSLFNTLGTGGVFFLALITFLVGLGVYKFVKDWLPW